MKTKLITALRTTATALENHSFHYNWKEQTSCNCGSLFCSLTGKSQSELGIPPMKSKPSGSGSTWTEMAGFYCPISGLPVQKLFRQLMGYGLLPSDIYHLEYLKNPKVLARLKVTALTYTNRDDVVRYMRAWADLLTEEGRDDIVPVPEAANRKPSFVKRLFGVKV